MAKLEHPEVLAVMKVLEDNYDQTGGLHDIIKKFRRPHFHQRREADPKMPPEWQHAKIQSPILNWKHREWVSRLTENEWTADIDPVKPTADGEKNSELAQDYFLDLFNQLENARGATYQRSLVDGQFADCYGVIHWYLGPKYKSLDDYDYDEQDDLGEEPEDDKLKARYAEYVKRYTEEEYEEGVTKKGQPRKKVGKYREKTEAFLSRVSEDRGRVPVWCVETPLAEQVYVEEHRSAVSQFKRVLYIRQVDVGTWWATRKENEAVKSEDLAELEDAPRSYSQGHEEQWAPDASQWGKSITLKQLWDSECVYEVIEGDVIPDGHKFKVYKHPYGMPPFALCVGTMVNSNSPRERYLPVAEGLYQLKPMFDRTMSLVLALTEAQSIPRYFLMRKDDGATLLDERGETVILSADAASSYQVPDGYELQKIGGEGISADFAGMLEWLKELMGQASPGTGRATFGASTQPWAARIQQAQENMEPKGGLDHLTICLKVMLQNMIDTMALPAEKGGPGEVWFMRNGRNGRKTESVKPEQWEGLRAEVVVDPVSSSERFAKVESALVLLEKGLITQEDFYGDFALGLPNPQRKVVEVTAYNKYMAEVLPGQLDQAFAAELGPMYMLTPADQNGISHFVDGTGMEVPAPQIAQESMAQQRTQQPTMPGLPNLNVQGASGPMNTMGGIG